MHDQNVLSRSAAKIWFLCVAIGLGIGLFFYTRGQAVDTTYRQSEFLLDTLIELTLAAPDERRAHEAMNAAFAEIRRLEALLSRYQDSSQIIEINRLAGQEPFVTIDQETDDLLRRALQYGRITSGFFDITVGPLIDLWGIGTDHEQIPSDAELRQILSSVDDMFVEMRGERDIRLQKSGMSIDLGGIAKGYSIDRAIAVLRDHQIHSALLNAGGDIRSIGVKPDGTPWRIGIRHPRDPSGMIGILELTDYAVVTSGDYERYFIRDGTRYHHILHPENGMPARECQSVTMLAETAERADALATAVFLMGPEQGLAFVEAQPGLEGLIIRADGELVPSSGFSMQPVK